MIVLSWSKATRDLLKSLGWGIRALLQLGTATMVPSPRRLPHTISPLQRGVCLSNEPRPDRRKAPHFGGGLRVAGDVRRDVPAANRRSLGRFSLTGIDAVPPR